MTQTEEIYRIVLSNPGLTATGVADILCAGQTKKQRRKKPAVVITALQRLVKKNFLTRKSEKGMRKHNAWRFYP